MFLCTECSEYTNDTADVVHALPLLIDVEPLSINVTKCEFSNRGVALVVGGTVAYTGEFPFMVSMVLVKIFLLMKCTKEDLALKDLAFIKTSSKNTEDNT